MEYPKEFTKCPNCGNINRIIQTETNEAIIKGDLKEGSKIPVMITRTLICDPSALPKIHGFKKEVPVIMGYFDVCSECGTLCCIRVEKGTATIEAQSLRRPPLAPPSLMGM